MNLNILSSTLKKNATTFRHLADYCFNFSGQQIPRVDYQPDEIATWGEVFRKVVELLPGENTFFTLHTCIHILTQQLTELSCTCVTPRYVCTYMYV
jgi:hypothetical protein